jgi:hypothetical protein
VTGRTCLNAVLFHVKPGKLCLQMLDAEIQGVNIRPVTARWSSGKGLVLNIGEIDRDARLPIVARGSG